MNKTVKIEQTWYEQLKDEFEKEYFLNLREFLVVEKSEHTVFPPGSQIFNAFDSTPFNDVKIVILGQDPYHNVGQAHGLCFSVPDGIPKPPSLKNIFKEINADLGVQIPEHGNLSSWAKQGVFLLNATLTVRAHQAGSHQKRGWEVFTDKVISTLSEKRENLVFLLWGRYAHNKEKLINVDKHLVLKSVHPSPLSAYNGFFGCKHFSKANEYLQKHNIKAIDWEIQ
jgi:uracil-DNA glycosylase